MAKVNRAEWGQGEDLSGGYAWTVQASQTLDFSSNTSGSESFDLGSCPSGSGFYVVHGRQDTVSLSDSRYYQIAVDIGGGDQIKQQDSKENWRACRTAPINEGDNSNSYLWDYFPNGDFAKVYDSKFADGFYYAVPGAPILALHDDDLYGSYSNSGRINCRAKDTHGDVTGEVFGAQTSSFTLTVELLKMVPAHSLWIKQRHTSRKLIGLRFERNHGNLMYDLVLDSPLAYTPNCSPHYEPIFQEIFFPFGGTNVAPGHDHVLQVYGVFDDGYEELAVDGQVHYRVTEFLPTISIALHFEV
tara:strand:+ start:9866 stop:10768 length:903 start_codon:yes stop_codon:yes gene_type:complete